MGYRLREDFTQSRIRETLSLFRELLELPSCDSKTIIVLLNKLDLFKEKIESSRKEYFQKFFTEYKGTTTCSLRWLLTAIIGALAWEPCANHIKQQFCQMAGRRNLYVHCITAVNTDNVKLIWADIRNALIKSIIEASMPAL